MSLLDLFYLFNIYSNLVKLQVALTRKMEGTVMEVCLSFLNQYLGTGHHNFEPLLWGELFKFQLPMGWFMLRHSDSGLEMATNANDEKSKTTASLTERDIFNTIFRLAEILS